MNLSSTRLLNLLAITTLLIVGFVFLIEPSKSGTSFALFQDNEMGLGPVMASISNSLTSFSWPLRMDTFLGGVPLYNYTQLSPFYPGYFFYLPVFNTPLQIITTVHYITLFHFVVLLINFYIFLQVLGVSRLASIVGAVSFTFCANTFSYSGWVNMMATYSWLPLYLAGLVGVLSSTMNKRSVLYALLGIVFLTTASPSQSLIHAIFISVVFVAFYLLDLRSKGKLKMAYKPLGMLSIVGLSGFLLSAPALLPALLEFKDMIRWVGPFPPVIGNAPIPFQAFLMDQMTIHDLPNILIKIKGRDVGDAYIGPLIIALALCALLSRNKHWAIKAIIFICFYSLLSSFGSNTGFAYVNHFIPFLNKIREPSRFLILFQLGICTLCAIGIDTLAKGCKEDNKLLLSKFKYCLLAIIILAAAVILIEKNSSSGLISPWISVISLAVLSIVTLIFTGAKNLMLIKSIPFLWGFCVVALLFFQVPRAASSIAGSMTLSADVVRVNKALDVILELDPIHEYRVIFEGGIDAQKTAMYASYKGIRTLNSYFSPLPYKNFLELYYHGSRTDNYFRALGVKYLLCEKCSDESIKKYKLIDTISGVSIYETQDVLARTYFANRIDGNFSSLADFQNKINMLPLSQESLFVPEGHTLLLNSNTQPPNPICSKGNVYRTPTKISVDVKCNGDGMLIFNEFYDLAWTAEVNGNPSLIDVVNGNQMGIKILSGESKVMLEYLPINFRISLYLLFAGIILTIYLLFSKRFYK